MLDGGLSKDNPRRGVLYWPIFAGEEAKIRNLKILIPYLRRYRGRMVLGLAAMLLSLGFSRLIPWLLKLGIDGLRSDGPSQPLPLLILAMVGAGIGAALFLYLQRWLLIGTSRLIEYDLRGDLFGHMQQLDLGFLGQRRTGDLMTHFTNDLNALRDVAGPGIMYAGTMIASLIAALVLMIALSPLLTLLAFAPYPLISAVTFFFGRSMHQRARRVQDQFGDLTARVQEDLSGARVIRSFGQEEACARNFAALSEDYLQANMGVAHLRGRFMAAMGTLAGSGLAIALLVGGRQVIAGHLSLGSLVAFSAYLAELVWPVIAIGFVVSLLQRGASAASRLADLLDARPAITSGPVGGRPRPRISFEGVTFRYPGATRDALTEISFSISPGETLGIVGRIGSGKSTILNLILRFYDPASGRILFDGVDLRERDLQQLRAVIGYAPQDAFLFSRRIGGNIAYGRPQAPRAEIAAAATQVRLAAEVAGFPEGLGTRVGERGVTLSGGQRQRVSLARALLLEPELLILDDTLASVDAETEAGILQELRRFAAVRTAIIVSHRISAIADADSILVLEDGRIAARGTHDELLAAGGLYPRLYERQRLATEIEEVG